jgi:hypothetical protein
VSENILLFREDSSNAAWAIKSERVMTRSSDIYVGVAMWGSKKVWVLMKLELLDRLGVVRVSVPPI